MTVLFTKYNNRKIYCSDLKRYVNLEEIISFVRIGAEVIIVDHETNQDVTNSTLKQCLLNLKVSTKDLLNLINNSEVSL